MTAHRNRSASVAGAFVLAFVLASCTANDPEPTPTPSGSATDATGELPPIEALQLEIVGDVDDDAWARVENDRFEAAVATCMQAAGFEYTPEEYVPDEAATDTETLAWAQEFGYGITTYEGEEGSEEQEEAAPTPNDLYISELTDEELDAYWIAYEGELGDSEGGEIDLGDLEDLDEDVDGEIDLGDLEIGDDGEIDLGDLDELSDEELLDDGNLEFDESGYGGCQGVAYDALTENPLPYDLPEHLELLTLLDAMYADVAVDERLADAEEGWIACMATAGYPDLATADDAQYLVFDAYDAAWEQVPEDADDIDPAILAPVTELEIAVATADFGCRESSGLDSAYTEAQHAAETTFIAEHRDGLVAFFEAMGAALKS